MRILILLAQYYPVRNPNVYRWAAIAEYWARQGHEVHVLCTRRAGAPDESLQNGVQVHRAGHATLLDWVYNVLNIKARRGEINTEKPGKAGLARKILEKIIDYTWRTLYWPDGSCLWYNPGKKRALQLQKRHDLQAVISVSLPFTANLIAMAMKQQYHHLHWHMDIEDPFSISNEFWVNNFILYHNKNFRAEGIAFQWADSVSVTVASAKSAYEKAFPAHQLQEQIQVIPPLINISNSLQNYDYQLFEKGKITLAYFGTFYERVRMPGALLEIMTAFFEQFPAWKARVQLHFFGEIPAKAWAVFEQYHDLQSNITFHGLVTRETVADAMQQADFLLNIGNTTNYHLPSKSAEYLTSGKPIINICQHPQDTFADFMKDYPLICNLFTSTDLMKNANLLHDFIKEYNGKQVSKEIIHHLSTPYTLEAIANAYFQLLSSASNSAFS